MFILLIISLVSISSYKIIGTKNPIQSKTSEGLNDYDFNYVAIYLTQDGLLI